MKHFFITGTDTDCGKTYVVCRLLAYYNQNFKAQALKPVASGCEKVNGHLISQDVERLQAYNNDSSLCINRWLFEPPVSPHLAALMANNEFDINEVAQFCQQKEYSHFDYLLIEGAGGLLVPLNTHQTWLDFLKLTGIPVILVVGMRLGCINHALLTDAVLKMNEIPSFGWIANCLDKEMLLLEENISTLKAKMHMPFIGRVPYNLTGGEDIEFANHILLNNLK
ncbi:dethiobiotin synthetase [Legionella busanensis]|uniref:ATP-dependent dethiobiotin synthetase BioD n=1 Tax=Legionella busanensis TaxID=190655 RepID=A0A378JJ87_9GAMM|nr:dethiobiotin synthase [Legionella busanensis]STX51376.1 dethiobiotin synthetase [Legionella busanensis]